MPVAKLFDKRELDVQLAVTSVSATDENQPPSSESHIDLRTEQEVQEQETAGALPPQSPPQQPQPTVMFVNASAEPSQPPPLQEDSAGSTARRSGRASSALTPRGLSQAARRLSSIPGGIVKGVGNIMAEAADAVLDIVDGPVQPVPARRQRELTTEERLQQDLRAQILFDSFIEESERRRALQRPAPMLEA